MNFEILRKGIVSYPPVDFQVSLTGKSIDYQASNWRFTHCNTHADSINYLLNKLGWQRVISGLEQNYKIIDFIASWHWNFQASNFIGIIDNLEIKYEDSEYPLENSWLLHLFKQLEQSDFIRICNSSRICSFILFLETCEGKNLLDKLCYFYPLMDSQRYLQQQYPKVCSNNNVLIDFAVQLGEVQIDQGEKILQLIIQSEQAHIHYQMLKDFRNFLQAWQRVVAGDGASSSEDKILASQIDLRQDFFTLAMLLVNLATVVRLLRLYTNAKPEYRNNKLVKSKLQQFALHYAQQTTNLLLILHHDLQP